MSPLIYKVIAESPIRLFTSLLIAVLEYVAAFHLAPLFRNLCAQPIDLIIDIDPISDRLRLTVLIDQITSKEGEGPIFWCRR